MFSIYYLQVLPANFKPFSLNLIPILDLKMNVPLHHHSISKKIYSDSQVEHCIYLIKIKQIKNRKQQTNKMKNKKQNKIGGSK